MLDDHNRLHRNPRWTPTLLGLDSMTPNQEAAKAIADLAKKQEWDNDDLLSFYETFIYAHYLTVGFLRFLEGVVTTEKELTK